MTASQCSNAGDPPSKNFHEIDLKYNSIVKIFAKNRGGKFFKFPHFELGKTQNY